MSKHTQEEWRAEPDGDHLMVCTDLLEICTIQPVDRGGLKSFYIGDETISNAQLIAAAPELIEALEHARLFIRNGVDLGYIRMPDADTPDPAHETLPRIEAAIAKARGE